MFIAMPCDKAGQLSAK